MEFNEYQEKAKITFIKSDRGNLDRLFLGICGEAGELAEVRKKYLRGDLNSTIEFKKNVKKEVGDILWYCAVLLDFYGVDFGTVAQENLDKLKDRKNRGKIKGSGNER